MENGLNPIQTDKKGNKFLSFLLGNRILLTATIIAIIALIIGLVSLFSMSSTTQYQGLIRQVETQTQSLNGNR